MKTKAVQLLIRRSLSSEPSRVVDAHEIPILKVIHGTGAVTVVDDNFVGGAAGPRKVKPRDELIRLKKKYRSFVVEGQNPVDVAFPDGSRDLELYYEDPSAFDMTGEEEGGGIIGDEEAESESEILDDEGNSIKTGAPVPAETPAPVVPEPNFGINLNDRPSILAALDAAEVPYAKTTATKHLATLLTNSLEQPAAK